MKKTNCIIKDNKNLSINPVLFPHRYLLALCVFLLLFFTAGCGKKEPVTDFVPEEIGRASCRERVSSPV